jgi:Tfp pilus assembly protein PilN
LLASLGFLTFLLLGLGFALGRINQGLAEEHRVLLNQQAQLQNRMLELGKRVESNSNHSDLQQRISELSQDIASKQQILQHLDNSPLLTETRFSHVMDGLSNSHVQGLWLTRVRADGNNLVLDGSSLSEELVPQWLHRLSLQENFQGKKFSALELYREQDASHLNFHLSTSFEQTKDGNG